MILLELHTRSLELAGKVVATVQPEQLVLATPCAGWTLRRLLEHVVGQHRGFAAAARGAGPDPALWRDVPVDGDPAGAFRLSAGELTAAFAEAHAAPRAGHGLWLPEIRDGAAFPLRQAVGFHLLDTLVHAWDVAAALGTPKEVAGAVDADEWLASALLSAAVLVPAAPEDRVPGAAFRKPRQWPRGAGSFDRVLALLGRDPGWAPPVR
ncbi:TIGR03086 family metal-binding protein [Streptomyces sp. CB01881]|uniref:TIGR03086 family metal-binding protein n=1 Tax=Streptomyces sp. CB01881 TaxID=2078691 RepID=UPI000CDC97BA|nr:TIGR03086 family metal-binding protein [Streptomyces sp. CB01881]AUY50565.1 TIGR03086 family protein [Streptomyces sp. CB01881]TYC73951.1 TIGR03086 family protein [Streptomyces sp. CB01881]